MALTPTNVIDGVTAEVDIATATAFDVTDRASIIADGFVQNNDEYAYVYRLGPSGTYERATNKDGAIYLTDRPNMVVLDGPATYKITKTATAAAVYVGHVQG